MRPGLTPDDFNVSSIKTASYDNLFSFLASLYNILLTGSELS